MKILFYLHFYKPEVGAASLRAQYFVKALEDAGHDVKVITPHPNYPAGKEYKGFEQKSLKVQHKENVTYLPILLPKTQSILTRGLSYISYFFTSLFYTMFLKYKYDLILSSSPPMFTALGAVVLSKIKKKPLILDIRDLWPDIGIELNIIKNPVLISLLKSIDKFILGSISNAIVPLESFRKRLINKNAELSTHIILNGADCNIFQSAEEAEKEKIRIAHNLPTDKKLFIYFGFFNFGMNDVDMLAEAIRQLGSDSRKIHFLFIGGGAKKDQFISTIAGKVEFTFMDPMPPNEIAAILPACDLSVIPLKRIEGNTGGFIPVKCLESWSAGVPVILSSSGDTEIEKIFEESGGGFITPAGESQELASELVKISNLKNLEQKGFSGRQYVLKNFDRKKQSEKLVKIVEVLEKS